MWPVCMANSKIVRDSCAKRNLIGLRGARSGRPLSASGGDCRPARRSRRRPFRRGRIGARQAPAPDPESVAKTVAPSPFLGSRGRRAVCARHAPGPVDPFRDRLEARHTLPPSSRTEGSEISPAVLAHGPEETGPQGTQSGRHRRRRRHETPQPDLGMSADRATDHPSLRYCAIDKDVVRRILADRYEPKPDSAGPSWLTVLGHAKDSLWSLDLFRCESAILHTHWVLVVMDQCTRRIVGFGVHRGVVDGVALCRMFNRAMGRQPAPTYLSSDHDPLYRFHQWQATLRILDVVCI